MWPIKSLFLFCVLHSFSIVCNVEGAMDYMQVNPSPPGMTLDEWYDDIKRQERGANFEESDSGEEDEDQDDGLAGGVKKGREPGDERDEQAVWKDAEPTDQLEDDEENSEEKSEGTHLNPVAVDDYRDSEHDAVDNSQVRASSGGKTSKGVCKAIGDACADNLSCCSQYCSWTRGFTCYTIANPIAI